MIRVGSDAGMSRFDLILIILACLSSHFKGFFMFAFLIV
jgi:hypothetical protein